METGVDTGMETGLETGMETGLETGMQAGVVKWKSGCVRVDAGACDKDVL